MMIIDAIIISSSYILSMLIAETIGYGDGFPNIGLFLVIIIAVKIIMYFLLGIYNTITLYLDYTDITKIVLATFFTNVVIVIYLTIPGITKFMPRSIYLFITTLEIVGLVLVRMFRRFIEYQKKRSSFKKLEGKRTLIIGAGSAAELAIKEIKNNKNLNNYVIGLLDDDPIKIGRTISSNKVLGTINDLNEIIPKYEVEEIVMAINNYPKEKFNDLLNVISEFDDLIMKRISFSGDLRKEQDLKIV